MRKNLKLILLIVASIAVFIFSFFLFVGIAYSRLHIPIAFDSTKDNKEVFTKINPLFLMTKDYSIIPLCFYARKGGGEWCSFSVYDDQYLDEILSNGKIKEKIMIFPHKEIKDEFGQKIQKYIIDKIKQKNILNPPSWWVDIEQLEKFKYYNIQTSEDKYIIVFVIHDLKNKKIYCFRCRL